MTVRVAVAGAAGKLGSVVTRLIEQSDDFEIVARLGSRSPLSDLLGPADAPSELVVDVTLPAVSQQIVQFAVEYGRNVLVGTSGWSAERIAHLERTLSASPQIGVLIVPNFSLGSALATAFATLAAPFFDSVEIVEAHAATKVDSPSGTAVRTAELMASARASRGPVDAPHTDQRARGQQVASIPVHSLRLDGVAASQTVVFGGSGEVLRIAHDTLDSSSYEAGIRRALTAATSARGLIVGLDKLIDLGIASPAEPADRGESAGPE